MNYYMLMDVLTDPERHGLSRVAARGVAKIAHDSGVCDIDEDYTVSCTGTWYFINRRTPLPTYRDETGGRPY